MTEDIPDSELAPQARAAWQFVQQMLTDVTAVITADAETERELLEGLRVVARITSLCAQLSVEADPERPRSFDMSPPRQMVGWARDLLREIAASDPSLGKGLARFGTWQSLAAILGTGWLPLPPRAASASWAVRACGTVGWWGPPAGAPAE